MEIPSDIFVNHTVEQGSIYYFPEESFLSKESHYFVVLNLDPVNDTVLVLTCGTSQVQRAVERRKTMPKETVVIVSLKECPELKRETAFDCNRLILKSLGNLIQKKEDGELNYKGKLTNEILTKLIKGVLASPMVERKYKKIIALN